jgi:hypothetical protein
MTLRVGDLAQPVVLEVEDDITDLSVVTVATFHVLRPNGTQTTWDATISDQSATAVTLTYTSDDATTDFTMPGMWRLYAELESGEEAPYDPVGRTDTAEFLVRSEFGVPWDWE